MTKKRTILPGPDQAPDRSVETYDQTGSSFGPLLNTAVYLSFAAFVCIWFRVYFTSSVVAGVDLPGHIAATELLVQHLSHGSIRFHDPYWFTGYPAFQFYAFSAHLLAALLSFPLRLISDEPVRLAAHLQLLFLVATLPVAFRYFLQPILIELFERDYARIRRFNWLIALTICAFTFWFINHDQQWFGIGAAAALNVGLFSQALAWHVTLFYFSTLMRIAIDEPVAKGAAGLLLCLLILTHTLTAIFALFVAMLLFAFNPLKRKTYAIEAVLGFALTSFWFLPFLYYSNTYVGQDIHRPSGDFLQAFLRYPLHGLIHSFRTDVFRTLLAMDLNNLIVAGCILGGLFYSRMLKSKLFFQFAAAMLLTLVIFGSGYIASSITLGLHYYRFIGYVFLIMTALCAVVPIALLAPNVAGERLYARKAILLMIVILSLSSSVSFPHYEREQIKSNVGRESLRDEQLVLDYLAKTPLRGRVQFEYFSDYARFPFLSAHYMESELRKRTGRESINGLFIQSSMAYRLPIATANLLGMYGYHLQLLFVDRAKLSGQALANQLRSLGITHIVAATDTLSQKLLSIAVAEPFRAGRYTVLQIANETDHPVTPSIVPVQKRVLAYLDANKTLPFAFMDFFFYAREQLDSRFEVLEVRPGEELPPQTAAIVVNGSPAAALELALPAGMQSRPPIVAFSYSNPYVLNHYAVWYQHSVELDDYNAAEKFLETTAHLPDQVFPLPTPEVAGVGEGAAAQPAPEFYMDPDGQSFALSGLAPGRLYRVNYSYFPYWGSDQGTLYRGSAERLFFAPRGNSATVSFSIFHRKIVWVGYLITVAAAALMFLRYKRR